MRGSSSGNEDEFDKLIAIDTRNEGVTCPITILQLPFPPLKIRSQGVHVSLARSYRQCVPSHCNRTQAVNSTVNICQNQSFFSLSFLKYHKTLSQGVQFLQCAQALI